MTRVLIVAARSMRELSLVEAVGHFHEAGADVALSTMVVPLGDLGLAPDDVHPLRAAVEGREPAFWRALYAEDSRAKQLWLHVEGDAWTLDRAAAADVIIALDPNAVFTVWQLAQRNPRAEARFGLAPGLDALAAVADRSEADEPVRTARPGADEPGPPDDAVAARTRPAPLTRFLGSAARADRRLARLQARADELGLAVTADLVAGRPPAQLVPAYTAELAYADALLERSERAAAAASYLQATRLAFHRGVHLDSVTSPLAADPAGFTAPLRASRVHQLLAEPHGRAQPARPAPDGRTRVLVVHQDNPNFLRDVLESFEGHPEIEVRVVGTPELGAAGQRSRRAHTLLRTVVSTPKRARNRLDRDLREHLDWADVVFLEWCNSLACAFTLIDPGSTRMVLRLHSYEAFALWPHLVDWSRIDAVVFVSEHLRDFVNAAVPALQASGVDQRVIANGVDLRRCVRDKAPDARFTLGMVGIGSIAKDVRWALEVIRQLRAVDPRYRLRLVGDDLGTPESGAARRYVEEYHRELAALEQEGAVLSLGHTGDVPAALEHVGVILSTSVRESQHVALLEGAASGAVPVVRNWPFFAGQPHGARTLFPAGWVVETPEEAVARVLATTADEETWRAAGRQASEDAIGRFDISLHRADFQKLLTT